MGKKEIKLTIRKNNGPIEIVMEPQTFLVPKEWSVSLLDESEVNELKAKMRMVTPEHLLCEDFCWEYVLVQRSSKHTNGFKEMWLPHYDLYAINKAQNIWRFCTVNENWLFGSKID